MAAELVEPESDPEFEWQPTRWWRVTYADGRVYPPGHAWEGHLRPWCETSSEREAREALDTCPGGGVLARLYERVEREWRTK